MRLRPAICAICLLVMLAGGRARAGAGPAQLDEITRIRVHLRSAYTRLAQRDVANLPAAVATRRRAALADLARYTDRGVFPRRTDDGYPGRRPRFIDDRGVHCAVGQLIADSGEPALARALDATDEYAYVPEMRSPALLAWAADHGFTVDELAMIQPTYEPPPPGPKRTRDLIEYGKDTIALRCARLTKHVPTVELRLRGDRHGATTATPITSGPYAKCLAGLIRTIVPPAEVEGQPYTITLKVTTTDPATRFRDAIGQFLMPYDCAPRPGPLARSMSIEASTGRAGLVVKVRTSPRNPETEACAEEEAATSLGRVFGAGTWDLQATGSHPIMPRFDDEGVWRTLVNVGPMSASACGADFSPPRVDTITITATGEVDDRELTVTIDGGDATFQTCLRNRVLVGLRATHGVPRRKDSAERYLRVDAPIRTHFAFDIH